VNGRDYTKLLELVPGASSDPVGSTESAGSYGLFSLNGNRGRSNNYRPRTAARSLTARR